MSAIGLYYPYIHVRDQDWLFGAALYWQKIGRIVPAGFGPTDSTAVRALTSDLDLMVNVRPAPAAASLAPAFLEMLDEYGGRLHDLFGLPEPSPDPEYPRAVRIDNGPSRHPELARIDPPAPPTWAPETDEIVGVHADQVHPSVRDRLCELGLAVWPAVTWFDPDPDWIGMRDQIAWAYMCALASEIARAGRLTPITDASEAQAFLMERTAAELAEAVLRFPEPGAEQLNAVGPSTGELGSVIGMLALQVPAPDRRWTAEDVVKVRTRYGADFVAFRAEVDRAATELAGAIQEIHQPEVLAAYLDVEITNRFRLPLNELRRQLRGLGLSATTLTLNAKFEVPAAAAIAGGGALLAEGSVFAGTSAVAAGLLAIRGQVNERAKHLLTPSAPTYLLHTAEFAERHGPPASQLINQSLHTARRVLGFR
ncbi:hypothetical protein GCM10009745_80010 [Kribbella yunnanensis]|uniref:Uncharacterized protein n=1 Tax=Kribbella yunnanensis TaxID=190194 RepID=A0ABP4V6X5_9ACTN